MNHKWDKVCICKVNSLSHTRKEPSEFSHVHIHTLTTIFSQRTAKIRLYNTQVFLYNWIVHWFLHLCWIEVIELCMHMHACIYYMHNFSSVTYVVASNILTRAHTHIFSIHKKRKKKRTFNICPANILKYVRVFRSFFDICGCTNMAKS